MLRDLFRRRERIVEIEGPAGRRETVSVEEYISRTIANQRAEAELLRMGFSGRRNPDFMVKHVVRRWMS